MDLKDLKYFVAVHELKSFSNAAKFLCTVPSNVSVQIRGLEDLLGEPLFERRWRTVVPTSKGDKFYAYAKDVIAKLDYGERMFKPSRAA